MYYIMYYSHSELVHITKQRAMERRGVMWGGKKYPLHVQVGGYAMQLLSQATISVPGCRPGTRRSCVIAASLPRMQLRDNIRLNTILG